MFENVFIAADIGESSEHFGWCKRGLKNLGVRRVLLGICIRMHAAHDLTDSIEALFGAEFEKRKAALEAMGYEVELEKLLGDPAVEVNRRAKEKECSLVVVDSRVNSLAGEVFLGGTAAVPASLSNAPACIAAAGRAE